MMLVVVSSHFTYSVLEVEIHLSKKGAENQVVEFEILYTEYGIGKT